MNPRTVVPIPRVKNSGLSSASNRTMLQILGMPNDRVTSKCGTATREPLKSLLVTEDVGPFRVTGILPAVQSLREIFNEIRQDHRDVYDSLDSAGMLCIRLIKGSKNLSNHSWGCAIDIKVDGALDGISVGGGTGKLDGKTLAGLAAIAPYFNKAGWYWGVGFSTFEDGMHFEVADQTIRNWHEQGKLGSSSADPTPSALSLGDRGHGVSRLQEALALHGYNIKPDGIFGAITQGILIDFQRSSGLVPDGIAGKNTWIALGELRESPVTTRAHPTLAMGDKGEDVEVLQQALADQGYMLRVDGDFGPVTQSLVISFQASRNLVQDGIVGAKTWAALGFSVSGNDSYESLFSYSPSQQSVPA